jgi:hypothetical protein
MRILKRIVIISVVMLLLATVIVIRLTWQSPVHWRGNIMDATPAREHASGPLRHSIAGSPYFSDNSGKAVYLTGSHVWNNLQEIEPPLRMDNESRWLEPTDPRKEFDFAKYLRFLVTENHNFIRLWAWEEPTWLSWLNTRITIEPSPFARTGPGLAFDGLPKFDLTKFNQNYFDRLRSRVREAGDNGIYVSVMLFEGWSIGSYGMTGKNPWQSHPFNFPNNINGVSGDLNKDNEGLEIHTLKNPEVTALQEAYVRKIVSTLNDLDNILYEIANESPPTSKDWQYHMINFIRECEANKAKQHPIGMTTCFPACENSELFASPADWISPNCTDKEDYCKNPPESNGRKVVITDTDHLCGVFCGGTWVWKSFARGLNPIFMDPVWMPQWESSRKAMGMTRAYAMRMDLARVRARSELASSGYCLANPESEYLVYVPFQPHKLESLPIIRRFRSKISNFRWRIKQKVAVDLSAAAGDFSVEWCDPATGNITDGTFVRGGGKRSFTAPFRGDAVLYLRKQTAGNS